ncbi:hypothetical protein [Tenggerimyces flavus]|uniref:Secreted protein n=1 Tax=Tenggerimyces flavus TaxID=1708749 RepID=A0ABV7Y6F6_9ACTN|nr:hypothetical protein [Tenggerimyces flavus]MBM7785039.1 hypothetical protein [Tenggerimyces flavus]
MRTAMSITAVAVLALTFGTAGTGVAVADTASGGTPRSYEHVLPGAGSASANATAHADGRVTGTATARGGRSLLPLPLPLPGFGTSSAGAGGSAERYFDAAAGTYEVKIRYVSAVGEENEGKGGRASNVRTSVAQFVGSEGHQAAPVIEFEGLPSSPATVTTTLLVSVPSGEAGRIWVKGDVGASAAADAGQTATARVKVSGMSFTINRIR